jgi:hypothetical protein
MQIQPARRPKDDISPFSTHVDQWVPRVYIVIIIHEYIEYFQEGLVGEPVDWHLANTVRFRSCCRASRKGLASNVHSCNPFPSLATYTTVNQGDKVMAVTRR